MQEADHEQRREPAQQHHPGTGDAARGGVQQQREPDAEQQGEDRQPEPRVPVAHGLHRDGGAAGGHELDVGEQDLAQREPAEHVERDDTGPP
ncbi:hypothetical protein [Nonomuraea salmonea]|uniref:hypothetical protein n=1 Tax=Nonomuraea salmonea TaxID=46181 RepID=UPI0031E7514E